MLTLALSKGRILDDTAGLLARCGIEPVHPRPAGGILLAQGRCDTITSTEAVEPDAIGA